MLNLMYYVPPKNVHWRNKGIVIDNIVDKYTITTEDINMALFTVSWVFSLVGNIPEDLEKR